jgi:hypothetical protein
VIFQVSAPGFTAGLVVEGDKVVSAAPILRYMVGWTNARAVTYCLGRSWVIHKIQEGHQ